MKLPQLYCFLAQTYELYTGHAIKLEEIQEAIVEYHSGNKDIAAMNLGACPPLEFKGSIDEGFYRSLLRTNEHVVVENGYVKFYVSKEEHEMYQAVDKFLKLANSFYSTWLTRRKANWPGYEYQ
jgi:hypothetical protein